MRALLLCLSSAVWFFSFPAIAKSKIRFDSTKEITIIYNSPSWNTDPEKIDTAFLLFRDANNQRVAQIQLEETEPDSSTFVGRFSITWADSSNEVSPEIYAPTPDMRKAGEQALVQAVQSGKLPRKPILVKDDLDTAGKIIAVFDMREQAELAWKDYQHELTEQKRKLIKPLPSADMQRTAEELKYRQELERLARQASSRETARERQEREERQRLKAAQDEFAKLSTDEQQQRTAHAQKLWNEAMVAYQANNFTMAENKFRAAMDNNPMETSYYFNYGVTEYRNDKMDQAMVSMRIAPDASKTLLEKKYYMGLIHLKLKELDSAAKLFDEVGASKDPVLGPSALYYKGVLLYTEEKYEEARKPFEEVIDSSQDSKLDAQAEAYLDKIANAIAWKKLSEQKFSLNATIGLMYDSNVLLSPDNQVTQGSATNQGDVRLLTIAQLDYRVIYNEKTEFAPHVTVNMTNSNNSSLSTADPWIYTFEAPYTWKTTLWQKAFRFTVRPGFEMLYMALAANQAKQDILDSPYIAFDNTFVMNDTWFATYTLQFRRDISNLSVGDPGYATNNDNLTANQWYLKTSQTFLLNNSKKEALIVNGGLVRNDAVGMNKTYDRLEFGVVYARPFGSWAWNAGLSFYYLDFPIADDSDHRTDENYAISTGVSKPVNDWFSWGVTGTYTNNASTQTSTYQYQKFVVMTTASFNTGW